MRAHTATLTDVERIASENQRCYFGVPDTAARGPAPIRGGNIGHEPRRFVGGVVRPEVMLCRYRVRLGSEVHSVSKRGKALTVGTRTHDLPSGAVGWFVGPQFVAVSAIQQPAVRLDIFALDSGLRTTDLPRATVARVVGPKCIVCRVARSDRGPRVGAIIHNTVHMDHIACTLGAYVVYLPMCVVGSIVGVQFVPYPTDKSSMKYTTSPKTAVCPDFISSVEIRQVLPLLVSWT